MYDSITDFLKSFSADSPLLWGLLVMVVIAAVALVLYGFWELVLRWVPRLRGSQSPRSED